MRKTKEVIQQTTNEILQESLKVFSSKGYQATNLQDIADSLGTTRTPMYYHFKNKLVLYEQAIEYYLQQKKEGFQRVFATDNNIFEKIREDLNMCARKGIIELTLFMGIDDLPELDKAQKMREEAYQYIYDLKMNAVIQAIEKGELRSDTDKDEFVNHLYILYYGFLGMSQNTLHKVCLEDLQKLIDTLIQGMLIKYSAKIW